MQENNRELVHSTSPAERALHILSTGAQNLELRHCFRRDITRHFFWKGW